MAPFGCPLPSVAVPESPVELWNFREAAIRGSETAASSREVADRVGGDTPTEPRAQPNDEAKHVFRLLARHIHPDLASNDGDRTVRTELMAQANVPRPLVDTSSSVRAGATCPKGLALRFERRCELCQLLAAHPT